MSFCFGLLILQCSIVWLGAQVLPQGEEERFLTPPTPPVFSTSPFYDFSPEDYMDIDKVGSNHCVSKEICDATINDYQWFPAKNCYCDSICALTGDCCPGFEPLEGSIPLLSGSVLTCVRMEDAVEYPGYGITMVTACDESWLNDEVRRLCESSVEYNDTLLSLPVSEPLHNIPFKNMYCSLCNYNYEFQYWKISIECNNITGLCISIFQHPNPVYRHRMCPLRPMIDTCNDIDQRFKAECENGSYSLVYAEFKMYKNKACAQCDGISSSDIRCEPDHSTAPTATQPIDPRKQYSFKMLVDFNFGHMTDVHGKVVPLVHSCKDNEMFDPMSQRCREILCPSPLQAKKGKCVVNNSSDSDRVAINSPQDDNCTFTKLDPSEYDITNDSRIFVFSSKTFYGQEHYILSGSDVFVCLNHTCPNCKTPSAIFSFDEVESYLSFVTLIISLVSLAITFFVYVFFQELLNTPGKILICLVLSLFLAQLMFLIAPQVEGSSESCRAVAVIMHYFFLAAFCWMNIVALDLWITFSRQFISPGSGSKSVKRFLKFSIYGWLVPLLIVLAALIVEHVDVDDNHRNLKPGYGEGVCWITSRNALLLFFAGPLAVFKMFDIIAFVFTSIHIIRAKRQGAMARQKTSVCSFLINLKLSLVMGLTWVFAFIANLAGLKVMWILFIVFNCLQGFFIAVSFLCTNKVKRLIRNKYDEVSKSKSSTQMTSLTPSKENN